MKYLSSFNIYSTHTDVHLTTGELLRLFYDKDSSKSFYRYKIQTISGVKHPGIYIGHDSNGNRYFAHNHIEHGRPVLETMSGFTKNQKIYLYQIQATNPPLTIISNALHAIQAGQGYALLSNNCQNYVHKAATNRSESPAIKDWSGRLLLGAFVFLGIRLLAR